MRMAEQNAIRFIMISIKQSGDWGNHALGF